MKFTVIILIVAVIFTAWAQDEFHDDLAVGNPKYEIKPMDPLVIDMLSVHSTDFLIYHFKNVTITGLKDLKPMDFKWNITAKSLFFSSKVDADIVSDVVVQLTGTNTTFTGNVTAKASAIETSLSWNYEPYKVKDKTYVEVGPELITCEAKIEPEVTILRGLKRAIILSYLHLDDENTKKRWNDYLSNKAEYSKEATCVIIKDAFRTIMQNIRAAAKVIPLDVNITPILPNVTDD